MIERAAEIVRSYETPLTLRQLFYRLVAEGTIPNTRSAYTTLSRRAVEARREGRFPRLVDRTRRIARAAAWELCFSIEGRRGGPDGAVLSALAVTGRPAGVGLSPLRVFPGDVLGLPETETLRLRTSEPFLARLLERLRMPRSAAATASR